ncbi:hypothetical protein RIR_jg26979.t1 [Rhizophagus irregularis DAOM 181602=DAOM 197198]|nr:hypothetical protein RIR_jg26979.t1 [Rhizophagus irregularis DAOM 181602=DAOM 197198]
MLTMFLYEHETFQKNHILYWLHWNYWFVFNHMTNSLKKCGDRTGHYLQIKITLKSLQPIYQTKMITGYIYNITEQISIVYEYELDHPKKFKSYFIFNYC